MNTALPSRTTIALVTLFSAGVLAGCDYCQPLLMSIVAWYAMQSLVEIQFPTQQPQP